MAKDNGKNYLDDAWWGNSQSTFGFNGPPQTFIGGTSSHRSVSSTSSTPYERCYLSHKPLPLGDTGLVIYGGSCSDPVVKDADVYIGFDWGMKFTSRHWPWVAGKDELQFLITDMRAPSDPASFKQLLDWTETQLRAGRKVHCGCMGGHGRTGTFLAALLCVMTGEKDAIAYVRTHYCKKAVESAEQVSFLGKQFGIVKSSAHKDYGGAGYVSTSKPAASSKRGKKKPGKDVVVVGDTLSDLNTISPMIDPNSIWGPKLR